MGIEKEVGRSFRPPGLEHPRADSEREGDGDAGGGAMSMTRREAAIKSCADRIRHLESVPPHYYGKRQRGRAIELEKVKIKALRPVSRERLSGFKTCDLVGELRKREGVEAHIAEQYQDVAVSVNGPAVVLVVMD